MNKFTKALSLCMCIAIIMTAMPLNFGIAASALTEDIYTYTVSGGEATITDCDTSASGDITIPSTLGGYPVTSLGYFAFENCELINSIAIPNSITDIGYGAFWNCISLIDIIIPNSVISISDDVFYNCTSLTSVIIPDSVTNIGGAFNYCTSLENIIVDGDNTIYTSENGVLFNKHKTELICYPAGKKNTSYTIPYGIIEIGNIAFYTCNSLTSITIPDSVTNISDNAFLGCDSLTSIIVDNNNVSYLTDNGVLFNKDRTELVLYPSGKTDISYSIPHDVIIIGNNAFDSCDSLVNIIIPDSVTSIGAWSFEDCTSLENITIPDSVTSIGSGAFRNCTSLENVVIGECVTNIDNWTFAGCTSLVEIKIPDSATSIGNHAFSRCSSLQSVIIGNGVTSIGDYAFSMCSINSVTIGYSVTSIGYAAFECYVYLLNVYYRGTEEQWNSIFIDKWNTPLTSGIIHYNYVSVDVLESGDIDGDGVVDAEDLTEMVKILLGETVLDESKQTLADANNDGVVDLLDLLRMKLIIAGMI